MSRRRSKSLESEWFDLFADWPLGDQEAALRVLTELHRQAVRAADRANKARGIVTVDGIVVDMNPPATGITLATALTKEQG
jgi:hypothetical protein